MAVITQVQRAKDLGITRDILMNAKNQGVNIWSNSEMEDWSKGKRHRLKPDAKLEAGSDEGNAQSLEEIEDQIRKSKDIETIKILKAKLDGLKIAVAIRKETRELVDAGEVRQSITKVVSAARGALLKLSSDLPPRLAGLSEAKMQPVIRAEIIEILTVLADETSILYAED